MHNDPYTVMRFNRRSFGIYHRPTQKWVEFGKYQGLKKRAHDLNQGGK